MVCRTAPAKKKKNSNITCHAGHWKTLSLLHTDYCAPTCLRVISEYCKLCDAKRHRRCRALPPRLRLNPARSRKRETIREILSAVRSSACLRVIWISCPLALALQDLRSAPGSGRHCAHAHPRNRSRVENLALTKTIAHRHFPRFCVFPHHR